MNNYYNDIRRVNDPRTIRVSNSYYIRDYYRSYIKTAKRRISEREYRDILYELYNSFLDHLDEDNIMIFPYRMGVLRVDYWDSKVKYEDDKLKITYAVDWANTLKFWDEDSEAKEDKTLLYTEYKPHREIHYYKRRNCYKNHRYYKFLALRPVKIRIAKKAYESKIKPLKYG